MQCRSKAAGVGARSLGCLLLLFCAAAWATPMALGQNNATQPSAEPAIQSPVSMPAEGNQALEAAAPSAEEPRQPIAVVPPIRLQSPGGASRRESPAFSGLLDYLRERIAGGHSLPAAAAPRSGGGGSGAGGRDETDEGGVPMWVWGVLTVAVGGGVYAAVESSGGGGGGGDGASGGGGTPPGTSELAFWLFEDSSDDFDMIVTDPTGLVVGFTDTAHYRQDSLSDPYVPDIVFWAQPPRGTYTIEIICYTNYNDEDKSVRLLSYIDGSPQRTLAEFNVPNDVANGASVRTVTYVY